MVRRSRKPTGSLLDAPAVREAASALLAAVREESEARSLTAQGYAKAIRELERLRGRPLGLPMLQASLCARACRIHEALVDAAWLADRTLPRGIGGFAAPEGLVPHAPDLVLLRDHLGPDSSLIPPGE